MTRQTQHKKPRLKIRSVFFIPTIIWQHPIRLIVGILIPLTFTPDIYTWGGYLWAGAFILAVITALFIAPLISNFLDRRAIIYCFYDDHLRFRESFLLREEAKIPYHLITGISWQQNFWQKRRNLAHIALESETRTGQVTRLVLPDMKNAKEKIKKINKLIQRSRKIQDLERNIRRR